MPVVFLDFGTNFAPGGSRYGGNLERAANVLPAEGGFHPFFAQEFFESGAGPTAAVTGAHQHLYPTGAGTASYSGDALTTFAGTKTALYSLGFWTNLSRAGGYAVPAGAEPAGWRMTSYGNDTWAANGFDILQRRANNAGLFADGPTSTFVPRPRFLAVVREALFAADFSANAGGFADEIAGSDFNDATWWDDRTGTRPASLAFRKAIRSRRGQITGLLGGEHGRIFKRNSIHGLQFTGGSDIWRIDEISPGVGCSYPGSLVEGPDGMAYFYWGKRFWRQAGFSPPEPISTRALEDYMADTLYFPQRSMVHHTPTTMAKEDAVLRGFALGRQSVVGWTFANTLIDGTTDGWFQHDRGLIYSPDTGAWTEIDSQLNISLIASQPEVLRATFSRTLDGAVGFHWDGTRTTLFQFIGPASIPATLTLLRQPILLAGETTPRNIKIKGYLPLFTRPDSDTFATPFPAPSPCDISVAITSGNEPLFRAELDADGATVSPVTEGPLARATYENDWGWITSIAEGRWFDFTVTLPSGGWRHFAGLFIDYE